MGSDRPKNLKLHNFLVRKTAVKTMLMEDIVEIILSHEKRGVNNALRHLGEVELSGFGKFYLSQVKLRKKLMSLEKLGAATEVELLSDPTNTLLSKKRESINEDLNYLRTKVKIDETGYKRADRGGKE